jgi:glycosyltransferase involved in cell wall biosynthesis
MLGGGEYSFLEFLTHLPPDWDAHVIVPEEGELLWKLKRNGIETSVISLPPLRPRAARSALRSITAYLRLARDKRPRLIYANGSRAAFYAGLTAKSLGLPVVWHCRVAQRDLLLDPLLCTLSTRIIANSHATAARFSRFFKPKVKVVHNGIDIRWITDETFLKTEPVKKDWKILLVVSRISKSKRHDVSLKAFEHVALSNPKIHLVCIGPEDKLEPEYWASLREKSRQSPFSARIHWVGPVDDIRPWYRTASILLLPSVNESFGRVLVEAMACGVPVVASRSGGVPEIVRDGQDGILVEPGKADLMAEAISRVLEDDDLRRRFSMSAIEQAKLFSLDVHVKRMVQLFDDTARK